jgi:molybdenum cofactor cytidylyltransferase
MTITGIILAAGSSSRMGRNKLLLKYGNHTVIEEAATQMLNSKADNILVITGHEKANIEKLLSQFPPDRLKIIYNRIYKSGRAESIKCALRSLDRQTDAALFMVADKPGVSAELIDRSIDKFRESTPSILYVRTPIGRGHPIIFARSMFDELLALEGDTIGNDLVTRHGHEVVELDDSEIQVDIDTEDDYIALMRNRPEESI